MRVGFWKTQSKQICLLEHTRERVCVQHTCCLLGLHVRPPTHTGKKKTRRRTCERRSCVCFPSDCDLSAHRSYHWNESEASPCRCSVIQSINIKKPRMFHLEQSTKRWSSQMWPLRALQSYNFIRQHKPCRSAFSVHSLSSLILSHTPLAVYGL